jgi:hypothetical protein
MPAARTYTTTILADPDGSSMTAIPVPFDPKDVFGVARPPVLVRLRGYEYRSTIFTMSGERFVPLRRSHREAAGVAGGERVRVTLTHDTAPRTVETPADLAKALRAAKLIATWRALSFTHQREHAEAILEARKPETRARRIEKCLEMLRSRPVR